MCVWYCYYLIKKWKKKNAAELLWAGRETFTFWSPSAPPQPPPPFLSDWSHTWGVRGDCKWNEIMSPFVTCAFSLSFYSCIMFFFFFCKYTEKNFMGFEHASIKLLFPDLPRRLHLFPQRLCTLLRLNGVTAAGLLLLLFFFFFLEVLLNYNTFLRTKDSLPSHQSRLLHPSWIAGLPPLPLAPATFATAVYQSWAQDQRGCQDDLESSAEISGARVRKRCRQSSAVSRL